MAALIFDFDGTIADTIDYFIDFIAKEAGLESLSTEQRHQLRQMSLRRIARELGHPWWRLPKLYYKGRHLMEPKLQNIKPFKGMPEVIKKLHAEGHELFIISSNSVHNMRSFLRRQHLRTSFLQIYGGVVVFGKAPTIRQLLREQHIALSEAVYIGDELRDIQAAQSVGMRVIAVSWGFAQNADLLAAKPTALVRTPQELLEKLEEM